MRKRYHFTLASLWVHVLALTAALFLVASINVLWWNLDQEATTQADLVDHTHQVISALEETLARADDMVIGQRGYAITHEQDFLKPYFTATNRMPIVISLLQRLVADNPKQAADLNRLEPLLANYEEMNRRHIIEISKGDPLAPDLNFRRDLRDAMDKIHVIVGQMISQENHLLSQRQEAANRATLIVTRVNFAAAAVSMGLIIAVFAALGRENSRRRASEWELQRSHEDLEDRVHERTMSLLQSETERKRLEQEILETSDNEMHRIGHDLHDGVGQQLTALSLFAGSLQKDLELQAPQLAESWKKVTDELRAAIRQVRTISHGLSPVALEENGLVEALRKLAEDMKSAKTDCRFSDASEMQIKDPHLAAQLYRIGQEAVTNAAKHSGASLIQISLRATSKLKELKVTDDGRGFALPGLNGNAGLGLRAMKYRADVIGAALQIDSTPGKGTQITCSLTNNK